jgi:hypothetical protein
VTGGQRRLRHPRAAGGICSLPALGVAVDFLSFILIALLRVHRMSLGGVSRMCTAPAVDTAPSSDASAEAAAVTAVTV